MILLLSVYFKPTDYEPKTICEHLQYLFALLQNSNRRYIDPSGLVKALGLDTGQQQVNLTVSILKFQVLSIIMGIRHSENKKDYLCLLFLQCFRCSSRCWQSCLRTWAVLIILIVWITVSWLNRRLLILRFRTRRSFPSSSFRSWKTLCPSRRIRASKTWFSSSSVDSFLMLQCKLLNILVQHAVTGIALDCWCVGAYF